MKSICCGLLALCLLCGCGGAKEPEVPLATVMQPMATPKAGSPASATKADTSPTAAQTVSRPAETAGGYTAPPFADAVFHETDAVDGVKLDLSSTADGYVAISATADARLKFQVIKDDITYTYNIASDGTPSVFPLQSGDGHYVFRVMENVVDSKYAMRMSAEADVKLNDEFQPFLRPSDYVPYSADSECVKKAAELAQTAETELDVVGAVFEYICRQVRYDKEKAANVPKGYLPDPDETMSSGKGICFDYAALAAAMLRSQGIPTQMIFGYVSPNDLYHAWNMFYTDETGWVTVEYQVPEDTWNRLDLTFSANGADDSFIGDGENYSDVYIY